MSVVPGVYIHPPSNSLPCTIYYAREWRGWWESENKRNVSLLRKFGHRKQLKVNCCCGMIFVRPSRVSLFRGIHTTLPQSQLEDRLVNETYAVSLHILQKRIYESHSARHMLGQHKRNQLKWCDPSKTRRRFSIPHNVLTFPVY